MIIPRRKFVKAGILAGIFAGVPAKLATPSAAAGTSAPAKSVDPLSYYNKAAFAAYINSDFRLTNGRSQTWLRLVLVDDFPTAEAATAPDECFRLLFSAPVETTLKQGTYQVDHAALGTFALFIVPGNPRDGKRHYEAVFNRRGWQHVAPSATPSPGKPSVEKRPMDAWDVNTATAADSAKKKESRGRRVIGKMLD